ncbi:unnamed protein product [Lactuca virosa]|uniref:Uncharacterized protein n=1 Tax=Lactuca virosa TaxID=75947 RepID=A0AAU9LCB8_9ASTR|nr:unnamed protein product [Lactuca virosa]
MVVGKVNLLQTTNTQLMVFKHSSPQHGCFNVPSLHLLQDPSSPSMCECCFKVATSYTSSIKGKKECFASCTLPTILDEYKSQTYNFPNDISTSNPSKHLSYPT